MKRRCGLCFIASISLSLAGVACSNPVFAQQDLSYDLEPIVVTKEDVHLLQPYSLGTKNLQNSAFSSPVELLTFTPLDLQGRCLKSGIQTDFSLRGSTYQGVLMLIDGQRVNDPQTGHHNSDLPLTSEDIQRIELIPGLPSSLFGPDAIGGAVNIIVKKPEGKKRIIETMFGSHQTYSEIVSITDKIDHFKLRLSLENQESEGFYYDTDFNKFTTSINSSLDIPDGEFNVLLGYQEKEFGAYDFYTPSLGYASKEWTKTYLLSTGFNLDKEGFIIKPNLLWRRHYDKFMLDKTQERSLYLNHHRTDLITQNLYFQKENEVLGKIGLGLEYGQERLNSTNLGKDVRSHKSLFLDNSNNLTSQLSLGSSARVDDYDDFKNAYTGSLSLRYNLSLEHSLYLGISRSIRIPSFTDLYYSDSVTAGNSQLSEEDSLNYEAGLDYRNDRFYSGITFFFREEEDFIDWVKQTPGQAKYKAENITEAEVLGFESYFRCPISSTITLDSNYTYINKHIDNHGYIYKYGQNYIRHIINAVLSLDLPFGAQSIGLTYKRKPNRNGWFLLSSHTSYSLYPVRNTNSQGKTKISNGVNKNLQVFLNITNLLNVEYQEIEGIPQPGRWFEAGLRIEW